MNPDVLQRADELIAAHNEAREQRGKTMTDQSETERQAEQVLSQLVSWVKQQAKANASSQQVIADYKAVMDAQRAEIETLRARPTASSDRDSIAALTAATNELNRVMADNAALAALLSELDDVRKERDAAVADNAALLNEMRRACQKGSATPVAYAELLQLALANEHPGKALLDAADHLATDSDRWRSLAMDMHDCLQDKTAWARAWKAAAKWIKEDRDNAVATWGLWHSEAIDLEFQLSEAQKRIAELEATPGEGVVAMGVLGWHRVGEGAHDLVRYGDVIVRCRCVTPSAWYYETWSTASAPKYSTAEEAMRAAEAALGVEVTR